MTKQCKYCGKDFDASKESALYCSNSCRTKANKGRRETERINDENTQKQAKIDEAKRDEKEARRLKRAKKMADSAAAECLAAEELKIQAEIDAWELSEKNRGINSIVGMLRVKAEATEKQRLEDEDRKKKEAQDKYDRDLKDAEELGKGLGQILITFLGWDDKKNKEQKPPQGPNTTPSSNSLPKFPPINTNPTDHDIKPYNMPKPHVMKAPGSPNGQEMTPYNHIKPFPPNNEPSKGNIAGNIIDMINGFFK